MTGPRSSPPARRRLIPSARPGTAPGEPRLVGLLYVLPALAFFAVFGIWPFIQTVLISFTRWRGIGEQVPVGLDNYADVLRDDDLYMAFVRAIILILFYAILPMCIGLLLAALLSRVRIRGLGTYRVLLFLPQVIAAVVIAIAWRWIYSANGVLNETLDLIGLGALTRSWLGDFDLALPAIGLVGTWLNAGLAMIFFVAGVQRIPLDLYDAARVDGAGPWKEFRAVTLPGLRNEIVVVLTITVIFALRNFDLIWVTTRGGPGDATTTPSVLLYELGFEARRLGSASAIAVLLTMLILAVTILIVRIGERGDPEASR
ncbi:MAG: sugar ABC transporter permease [Chloroflexi bacterium]|nr:sugar ABC transporter permease [Chloroflexota bacterium]